MVSPELGFSSRYFLNQETRVQLQVPPLFGNQGSASGISETRKPGFSSRYPLYSETRVQLQVSPKLKNQGLAPSILLKWLSSRYLLGLEKPGFSSRYLLRLEKLAGYDSRYLRRLEKAGFGSRYLLNQKTRVQLQVSPELENQGSALGIS